MTRKIAYWVALAILALTGILGIYNGVAEWGDAQNAFQASVTGGVLAYGVLGLLTVYASLRRKVGAIKTAIAWAIVVTYVPGAAVMAYGDAPMIGSAIGASVGGALIGILVVWAIRGRAVQDRSVS